MVIAPVPAIEGAQTIAEREDVASSPLPPTKMLERADRALAAVDRALESPPTRPRMGLRARFHAWRDNRRRRALIARLDRSLEHRTVQLTDQSSAALLAVLTERIARIAKLDDMKDLPVAIEVAQHVASEYRAYRARLSAVHDNALAEAAAWRVRVTRAETAEEHALASAAEHRAREWEKSSSEAEAALDECDAGRHRIDDALTQLEALAKRGRD